jgi:hypothetical protein
MFLEVHSDYIGNGLFRKSQFFSAMPPLCPLPEPESTLGAHALHLPNLYAHA